MYAVRVKIGYPFDYVSDQPRLVRNFIRHPCSILNRPKAAEPVLCMAHTANPLKYYRRIPWVPTYDNPFKTPVHGAVGLCLGNPSSVYIDLNSQVSFYPC